MALPLPYDIRLYLQFDIDDYIGYQTDNEMTATATQKDQICESLKNTNGTECNMVAIGKTSKRIVLATKDCFATSHTRTDNQTTGDIFPTSTKYQPSKDIHKDMSQSYVLAMGRTKKRVLLITKDLYVYDAPADSFDSSKNKVYFKYMPTPMKDKYPVLYDNSIFQKNQK
ncbi:hypothetical protein DERP_009720 [Dermatophagoides pteronyssinus]|uniref:Uncharacterized protein n=1 Tax=Dermatophagoides pteronyssinus TaxID=6956 RepID=A0ABQ8IQZ7_DERPT|nr:hypothetical protein DERP_009720 [Dermatophagoides pteronyssinus]